MEELGKLFGKNMAVSVAIRFRWRMDGRVGYHFGSGQNNCSRNPLSLENGWKRSIAWTASTGVMMSQSAFAGEWMEELYAKK